jgi:hypothetical protein
MLAPSCEPPRSHWSAGIDRLSRSDARVQRRRVTLRAGKIGTRPFSQGPSTRPCSMDGVFGMHRYISFNNRCPTPTPWPSSSAPSPQFWSQTLPLAALTGQPNPQFSYSTVPDVENNTPVSPCGLPSAPSYLCTQAVVYTIQSAPGSSALWWSNMQFEYR